MNPAANASIPADSLRGSTPRRNPGPAWGCDFLRWADRWWPRWIFRPLLMAGTWVALPLLPAPRAYSRAYLAVALGRPPQWVDVWRHFFAKVDTLLLQLRVGHGTPCRCRLDPAHAAAFEALVCSPSPALFGTFHFGGSDLLGFLLAERGRRVSMLRLQVGNSPDTRLLAQRFAGRVALLWVNDPASVLFALKAALEAGDSLALKCDRWDFSAKTAAFRFLGASRRFPVTIYHLALLFARPVVFCTAVPDPATGELQVFASAVFTPDPAADRAANTRAAHQHFQQVLAELERLVRAHPYLWFNFLPLNPEVTPANQLVGAADVRESRPVRRPEPAPSFETT